MKYWYPDPDGDGFGDQSRSGDRIASCAPVPGRADNLGDCDERDASVNTAAVEVCGDHVDNDCDGSPDGPTAWWDPRWPHRVPLSVSGSGRKLDAAPVTVDLDLVGMLAEAGISGDLNPDSIRVVHQSCAAGMPEVPSQFSDNLTGLFDAVDSRDALGDGAGTVAFHLDLDGDPETVEALPASGETAFAVYFATTANEGGFLPGDYPTGVFTDNDTLVNGITYARLSAPEGGLLARISQPGSPSLGSQTAAIAGNGVFSDGWMSVGDNPDAIVTSVEQGPILSVLRAEGRIVRGADMLDYRYTWWMFDRRPEVYVKVDLHAVSPLIVGPQLPDATAAIRPVQLSSATIGAQPGPVTVDEIGGLWRHQSTADGRWGLGLGWRTPPTAATTRGSAPDFWLQGSDAVMPTAGSTASVSGDVSLLEHGVVVLYPHAGAWVDVAEEFLATMNGVQVAVSGLDSRL